MTLWSRREQGRRVALMAADGIVAGFAVLLASELRDAAPLRSLAGAGMQPDEALGAAAVAAVLTPSVLLLTRRYDADPGEPAPRLLWRLAGSIALAVGALMAVAFALQFHSLSRGVVLLAGGLSLSGSFTVRMLGRALGRDRDRHAVLVVGSGPRAQELADRLASPPHVIRVVGFLDDDPELRHLEALGDRFLGPLRQLLGIHRREAIDEVIVAVPRSALASEALENLVAVCEVLGLDVTIAGDLFETRTARPRARELAGRPAVALSARHNRPLWAVAVKRATDVGVSLAGGVVLLPVWIAIALAIKLTSPGPVIFVQQRSGLGGRTFPLLKFRTMREDAEEQLDELRKANEAVGPVFKIAADPRVTRVGRFLRRSSLDESPQLLNVLVGHMSLVGPRPPVPSEVDQYEPDQYRRLSVRPGMTGPWQVAGRNLIPFEDWVRLDLQYIDEWSLGLDFQILLATIPAVLRSQGAQ